MIKRFSLLFILPVIAHSCMGQNPSSGKTTRTDSLNAAQSIKTKAYATWNEDEMLFLRSQISQYVRRMFQDKSGSIWFGTNGDGVCRYDPSAKTLMYFKEEDGLAGNVVRGILQDENDNIWFATSGGISCFLASKASDPCAKNTCGHDLKDPDELKFHRKELSKCFATLTMSVGLDRSNQVWSMLKDRSGLFWFGTEEGVFRYDGKQLSRFDLPAADLRNFPNAYGAPKLMNCIYEDKEGIIWFASNGNGVYRWDGKTISNLSEKDGLCNNFVQSVLQDSKGNFWFATRFGGICNYDGKKFYATGNEDLDHCFGWTIMEDKSGKLWFTSAGSGLFRRDGNNITHYTKSDGLGNMYVQSLLQDKNGNLWVGTSGGVYRFNGKTFTNFIKEEAGK